MADRPTSGVDADADPARRRQGVRPRRPAWLVATVVALPVAALAGLLAFWRLGGLGGAAAVPPPAPSAAATGPVAMPARNLSPDAMTACAALLAALPAADGRLARRPVTAGPEQNAAYGDPAVTLACGADPVPRPAPTATVYPLSGVCWYVEEQPDGTVWTTVDRRVPVRVRVPRWYDPPAEQVIVFSKPVAAAVEPAADRPSGC